MKSSSVFYKRNLSLIYLILSIFFSLTMVNVPVRSDPYETRLFIRESPPGSWIDGGSVSTYFFVIVEIESPIAWDDTANGIVGWVFSVHVDPSVLQIWASGAYGAGPDYWLYDFASDHGCVTYLSADIDATAGDMWVGELISGCSPLGVGAGGNSGTGGQHGEIYGLCRLRFKKLSDSAYSRIDIYDAYWVDINGTQHAFDVVDDGHYNTQSPPSVPEFPLGGAIEITLMLAIVFVWLRNRRKTLRAPNS